MGEGLARRHQIKVLIGLQLKEIHHLRDHLTMLSSQNHPCFES